LTLASTARALYGSESPGTLVAYADAGWRMVLDVRSTVTRIVGAATVVVSAACYCGEPEQPEPKPAIATIEIIPSPLSAPGGAHFIVRARLRDQWGNILPSVRAKMTTWSVKPGLRLIAGIGDSAVIEANPGPEVALPYSAEVTASLDVIAGTGTVIIVPPGPKVGAKTDWIKSDFNEADPPTVALIDGTFPRAETSIRRSDSVVAFVGGSPLETFECDDGLDCGDAILFAPGHALSHAAFRWTQGCDLLNYTSSGDNNGDCSAIGAISRPVPTPLKVEVIVWNYSSGGNRNQIGGDIAYAEDVFSQPLIGISLQISQRDVPGAGTTFITHGVKCQSDEPNDITSQISSIAQSEFKPDRISVVYVDGINRAVGDETGFTCPYDPSEGSVILMSTSGVGNSALAHELGHALGEWTHPAPVHPDVPPPRVAGIDPSNLMWSGEVEWAGAARRNLTLGQLAQMNLSDFSFVKRSRISGGEALSCQPDPMSEVPCPRMAKDFTK
jgi:hypothetical protein